MNSYNKEWFSLVLLAFLIATEFAIFIAALLAGIQGIHLLIAALVFILYINFFTLGIFINQDYVKIKFGLGLFTNIYPISTIESSFIAENNNIMSWVYNPTGKTSIKLRLRNGSLITLPAADDFDLSAVLSKRR